MTKKKKGTILWSLATALLLVLFILVSNLLAPLAAGFGAFNPVSLLSLGAPAVFGADGEGAVLALKLEPWRLFAMQLPAFAGINPGEWQEAGPPPLQPINPVVTVPRPGRILIYHTHASEAFVPTAGEARSEDFSQTIVQLGQIIAEKLEARGISVSQDRKFHDVVYNKSYAESRKTAQAMLAQSPDTLLLLDIHRDGVGKTSAAGRGVTTAFINGRQAGQIMFVLSSAHEGWEKNHKAANDLHNIMEDKYPGLSRGILVRLNSTYNQDLHPGALLVEIGGHWNTLEEVAYGAELFAEVLADYSGGSR